MEYCAYFIKDKAIFGKHPLQEQIEELEENGVRYFIDLTCKGEKKIKPYTTKYTYINYPITDHRAPNNWITFSKLILQIVKIINNLKEEEKVYINCKAGIGRSGMVAACVLCYIGNLNYEQAINITTKCHRERKSLKEHLKKMTSPQTMSQKNFVRKFFEPLYFYRGYKNGITFGFSNFSLHSVNVKDIGIFPTSEAAIQAHKNLKDLDYVDKQLKSKTPNISKKLGKFVFVSKYYENNKDTIIENIIRLKIEQNEDIKNNLLKTGLKYIVSSDINDDYLGIGIDKGGKNMLGKILMKIRDEMYEKYEEIDLS
jgi:ribA/ribD-fused uncharacterized protein